MSELLILIATAASIGFLHTILGPDHYLPFIMMSKARRWSLPKTSLITVLCGIGHVLSSVLLGLVGIALGIAVTRLEGIESVRGDIAAWGLIAFGLVYFVWGLRRAIKNKPHTHKHLHLDGMVHEHDHVHKEEHVHIHESGKKQNVTPWVLFVIFVLGPCEPLIPILMYPAAQSSAIGVMSVILVFGTVTVLTMLSVVLVSCLGISVIPRKIQSKISMKHIERYTHALAGGTIALSGMAIVFLGL